MIILPNRITRAFIRAYNGTAYFIYGDCRTLDGKGGQATEARGEPNAYVIPTKYQSCANEESYYFTDKMAEENHVLFHEAMSKVPADGKPVIVFPKLGLGWNKMDVKAPLTYAMMKDVIRWYVGTRLLNPNDL